MVDHASAFPVSIRIGTDGWVNPRIKPYDIPATSIDVPPRTELSDARSYAAASFSPTLP